MQRGFLHLCKDQRKLLTPGRMTEAQFWLLVEVSSIHSEKIILALKDFLVSGYTRREVCERNKISSGYFSSALGRFQHVNLTVSQLVPYYMGEKDKKS
ncbi:adhesin biosynthesis transcription regulatory family protein [Klebsiella aerogenes]|nr:adhesin biosynthesis transcription regulatory family protein [Klebsiella aerogenes]ELY3087354.1 adhesin biosynthesis transcription regulatory family protein [Klebsiella aerogenes]